MICVLISSIVDHSISCSTIYYVCEYLNLYELVDPVGSWGKCLARGKRSINCSLGNCLTALGLAKVSRAPRRGSATDLGGSGSAMGLQAAGSMGIIQGVY